MAERRRKRARTTKINYGKTLWTIAVGTMLMTAWLTSSEIQASEEFGDRSIASEASVESSTHTASNQ